MTGDLPGVPIQVQALVRASGLEGLHRTCEAAAAEAMEARRVRNQPAPTLLEDVTRPELKGVRKAAVAGAEAYLKEHSSTIGEDSAQTLSKRIRDSLGLLDQASFRERLVELLTPVHHLARGCSAPTSPHGPPA